LQNLVFLKIFRVLYYIRITKFVKPANFCILEDLHVLYYIKYTKFDKLAYTGI